MTHALWFLESEQEFEEVFAMAREEQRLLVSILMTSIEYAELISMARMMSTSSRRATHHVDLLACRFWGLFGCCFYIGSLGLRRRKLGKHQTRTP
jgi:hypothetical protein